VAVEGAAGPNDRQVVEKPEAEAAAPCGTGDWKTVEFMPVAALGAAGDFHVVWADAMVEMSLERRCCLSVMMGGMARGRLEGCERGWLPCFTRIFWWVRENYIVATEILIFDEWTSSCNCCPLGERIFNK
jgi:hypothetical protein